MTSDALARSRAVALDGPVGVEPTNDWFKASLLYQFAYSPMESQTRLELA